MRKPRRDFIATLAGAVVAPMLTPRAARTQQPARIRRIAFLSGLTRPASIESSSIGGLLQGMRELGYVEGKDFVVEWRFAEGNYERFADFANEFVRQRIDIFVLGTPVAARAVQQATSTIPIVLAFSTDPVGNGFVASLAHPGGNITGLATSQDDTAPKQLELLGKAAPNLSRVGVLMNPASPNVMSVMKGAEAAAHNAGIDLVSAEAHNQSEIKQAFDALSQKRAGALMVVSDSLFQSYRKDIGALALSRRLPSMFAQREYVEAGGLMSYGEHYRDFFRRAAIYVDKIFKGARPADLPVEQPTRFYLVLNSNTAKALGLAIPPTLLALADEVIE
jgi:putative ABC transport system substrate-binding protein